MANYTTECFKRVNSTVYVHEDFKYSVNAKKETHLNLRCILWKSDSCKGTAILYKSTDSVAALQNHNHEVSAYGDLEAQKLKITIRQNAALNLNEILYDVFDQGTRDSEHAAKVTYKRMRSGMYKARKQLLPNIPATAEEFHEPIEKTCIAEESSRSNQINQPVHSASINKKKRQKSMPDLLRAKKKMDEAFSISKERETINKPQKVHECDLYAQFLAEKLKKIDEERRIILMHNIDNLVFQEIMSAKAQERAASVAGE